MNVFPNMTQERTVLMALRNPNPRIPEVAVIIDRGQYAVDDLNSRPIIIGRSLDDEAVDIDLAAHGGFRLGVSRRHVELRLQEGRWYITDLGSRNGTALEGIVIEPYIRCEVADKTRIILGDLPVRLFLD